MFGDVQRLVHVQLRGRLPYFEVARSNSKREGMKQFALRGRAGIGSSIVDERGSIYTGGRGILKYYSMLYEMHVRRES